MKLGRKARDFRNRRPERKEGFSRFPAIAFGLRTPLDDEDLDDEDFVRTVRHDPSGSVVAQAKVDTGGPTLPRRFLGALHNIPLPPSVRPIAAVSISAAQVAIANRAIRASLHSSCYNLVNVLVTASFD